MQNRLPAGTAEPQFEQGVEVEAPSCSIEANDAAGRIALAHRYALGREPDATELRWSSDLYTRERDRFLHKPVPPAEADLNALAGVCHVLFNSNEFLYVE